MCSKYTFGICLFSFWKNIDEFGGRSNLLVCLKVAACCQTINDFEPSTETKKRKEKVDMKEGG